MLILFMMSAEILEKLKAFKRFRVEYRRRKKWKAPQQRRTPQRKAPN
jgi:hypothetical protein